MNNIEMIKDKASQAEVMTRKIFLAGIGAYGKSFENSKSRFESLTTESNKMFAEFVARGEKLETESKNKFSEVQTKIFSKADLNNRVIGLRSKLGLNNTDDDQKIEALNTKIDLLTTAVAKLTTNPVTKATTAK
jgi:hypothetical protein